MSLLRLLIRTLVMTVMALVTLLVLLFIYVIEGAKKAAQESWRMWWDFTRLTWQQWRDR